MNGVVSTSYGSGDYSGEVIIPIPKEDKSGLNSVMSFLESAVKLVSPTAGKAISYMGMLFGETSLYKSKSSITNIRAKSSGTIELEAKSFFDLNGYTVFSAELNLKELNGNKDMGLWTLSKNPVFTYDKYSNLNQESLDASGRYVFRGQLNTTYDIDVIISPHIKPLIKSYSIESIQFFYESEYKTPNMKFITEKISDNYDRYTTNLQFLKYGNYVNTTDFTRLLCIYSNNIPALSKLCVNITVKFNYTDGSEFISNRNFRPDFIEKDNSTTIQKLQNMGATIIWR